MNSLFDLSKTGFDVPLLWIFLGGGLLALMPRQRAMVCGRETLQWSRWAAFLLAAPMILWAGFRSGGDDTYNYMTAFDHAAGTLGQIPEVLTSGEKDPGYKALMILCKALGIRGSRQFLLLVAAIQVLCMAGVLRRYCVSYWTGIFLFIASTDYLSWMENGMRQFLAVCLTFGAFPCLVERKYVRYAMAVLLASVIHSSAPLMLPVGWVIAERPLGGKTMTFLAVAALAALLVEPIMPMLERFLELTPYAGVTRGQIWISDDGTNLLRVAVYSVPAALALAGKRWLRGADRAAALCINSAVVTMGLYCFSAVTSGIYVGRLPIYTTLQSYMALCWLLEGMFTPRSARLMRGIMIGCYLVFYVYQVRVAWGW